MMKIIYIYVCTTYLYIRVLVVNDHCGASVAIGRHSKNLDKNSGQTFIILKLIIDVQDNCFEKLLLLFDDKKRTLKFTVLVDR